MNKSIATERTKQIIQSDRSRQLRAIADETGTYCLYSSVYEAAIHHNTRTIRQCTALRDWQSLQRPEGSIGGVNPDSIFSTITEVNGRNGLMVSRVSSTSGFYNLTDLPLQEAVQLDTPSPKTTKKRYRSHAEFDDGSPYVNGRMDELHQEGWTDAMTIEIKPNRDITQQVADIVPLARVVKGTITDLQLPFLRILVKEIK